MKDEEKTKEKLTNELKKMRKRIVELEASETERKRMDEALCKSEERLFQIIQGNSVPAFVIDSNHIITYWNMACENLTGIYANEVIGTQKQWSAFYPSERPVMADLIVDNLPKEEITRYYGSKYQKSPLIEGAYEAEDFFPHLGEKGKWLFFTAAPLRDSEGKISGEIETLQDIAESKKAEKALRESEEKYRNILESIEDGYYEVDLVGNFTFFNMAIMESINRKRHQELKDLSGEAHQIYEFLIRITDDIAHIGERCFCIKCVANKKNKSSNPY